jgi:hypothetical protein
VLAQVQAFSNTNNNAPPAQFGNTSLRLYLQAPGSTTWFKQDINVDLDGQADTYLQNGQLEKKCRKDDEMAADAAGNLYVEYSSDASLLAVDRIPKSMLQDILDGVTLTDYPGTTQILSPQDVAVFNDGAYRPQLAVGSLGSDRTAVYVFGGDSTDSGPLPNMVMWAWEGGAADSFSVNSSIWETVADDQHVGAVWAGLTVSGDGTLYGSNGTDVYQLAWSATAAPAFSHVAAVPPGGIQTEHNLGNLGSYTSGGVTTLVALANDAAGHLAVATMPASGVGAWSVSARLTRWTRRSPTPC